MPRKPRVQFPGALYHITTRGNGKQSIFLSNRDRREFLRILQGVILDFSWLCYAYCLMTNHYHLLVETPEGNLSDGMQQLNSSYSQCFNLWHEKVGHVTQGRYFARLVENDEDLFVLYRYILLNPVKDGFVDTPEEWRWSSYRATAGLASVPTFLHVEYTLSFFSEHGTGRESFTQFILDGLSIPESRNELLSRLLEGCFTREERADAVVKACDEFGFTRKEIAECLRIDRSTVSRILSGRRLCKGV